MKQTGEEYRLQNKKRLQRYFNKHLSEGKKRITALLDGDVYALLIDYKDREGISIGAAVENALRVAYGEKVSEPVHKPINDPVQDNIVAKFPHSEPDDLSERDADLIRIYESLPGRDNAQARADALNEAGVYIKGGVWNKKNAGDVYRKAKRQGGV